MHEHTPHFGSSSITSTYVLCWCISFYRLNDKEGTLTSEDACVPHRECFQLRVAEYTPMMWDSPICLLYLEVLIVLCAFVRYMIVMFGLRKTDVVEHQVVHWEIQNLYIVHRNAFRTWESLVTCTEICSCCNNTHLHKKITLFLLSVVLSALCHHKGWLIHISF